MHAILFGTPINVFNEENILWLQTGTFRLEESQIFKAAKRQILRCQLFVKMQSA